MNSSLASQVDGQLRDWQRIAIRAAVKRRSVAQESSVRW